MRALTNSTMKIQKRRELLFKITKQKSHYLSQYKQYSKMKLLIIVDKIFR
jgi:hypothetical protein